MNFISSGWVKTGPPNIAIRKMRKYKKNTKMEIFWIDVVTDPEWLSDRVVNERPDCDCKTVGYYIKHDKELLWLSHTISRGKGDRTTIPIGCIKKVKILCAK